MILDLHHSSSVALSLVSRCPVQALRNEILLPVVRGEKKICMADREPDSDKSHGVQTTAVKDGKYFVINGTKKWIIGGTSADLILISARLGQEIVRIVVPADTPGVQRRKIKTSGLSAANISFLSFDNVRIPTAAILDVPVDTHGNDKNK